MVQFAILATHTVKESETGAWMGQEVFLSVSTDLRWFTNRSIRRQRGLEPKDIRERAQRGGLIARWMATWTTPEDLIQEPTVCRAWVG